MKMPDQGAWRRLSPLLDELLDLPLDHQAQRLQALRKQDPALSLALEELLQQSRAAAGKGFLAGVADAAPAETLIGHRVGAYLIEALLGQGGTGTVWRATRADGRFRGAVAIKLLHLSLMGRMGATRFKLEGVILARLDHPNIARLLDAGVTEDGQPFLVIELVDGMPIDRYCDERRLNVEQRIRLMRDVLAGVGHAHSRLIVHRDIKPNNILVDTHGTVKLLDFGVAKLLEDGPDTAPVTMEQHRALTPRYAAPEQLQGGVVTTATDLYALGVLLFHLLVGRHPTAPQTGSPADIIRTTVFEEPMRLTAALDDKAPSTAPDQHAEDIAFRRGTPLARLRRQMEGDLENILSVALRKDPDTRYATAAALADDLRRYQSDEPVSARPDSTLYRFRKFTRRNRGKMLGALLSAIAVAAGAAGTVLQSYRAEQQATQAQVERDYALQQLRYAKSTKEFLTFLLQEGSDRPVTTAELLEHAEPMLEGQFAGDVAAHAKLLGELAGLYIQSNYLKKARPLIAQAEALARTGKDPELLSDMQCTHGYLLGIDGAVSESDQSFDQATKRLRSLPHADRATLAECLQMRADIAQIRGDGAESLRLANEAVLALGVPRAEDRVVATILLQTLAYAHSVQGQNMQAATEYRQVLAELNAMGRGQTRLASGMLQNLGVILSRSGQTSEAFSIIQRALAVSRGLGGANASLESNSGSLLLEFGRTAEAVEALDGALRNAQTHGDARTAATVLPRVAKAHCVNGQLEQCEELIGQARHELAALAPSGNERMAEVESVQAHLDRARGKSAAAREDLDRAIKLLEDAHVRGRSMIVVLADLSDVDRQLGDLAAAAKHADVAVSLARTDLSGFQHSLWLGKALRARGLVHIQSGERDKARNCLEQALAEFVATIGESSPQTREAQRLLRDG